MIAIRVNKGEKMKLEFWVGAESNIELKVGDISQTLPIGNHKIIINKGQPPYREIPADAPEAIPAQDE